MHGERGAAEEGDNEEMELWCEGSEVWLLGEMSTRGKSLTSLCSCLGDGLLSVPAWVIGGLLFTPALGKGWGCLCSFMQLDIKPPCQTTPLTLLHTGLPRHNQVL